VQRCRQANRLGVKFPSELTRCLMLRRARIYLRAQVESERRRQREIEQEENEKLLAFRVASSQVR
jgi:hypothetical protein